MKNAGKFNESNQVRKAVLPKFRLYGNRVYGLVYRAQGLTAVRNAIIKSTGKT